MLSAVERFLTKVLTRKPGSLTDMAGHSLGLFAAVTGNLHIDIARRTSSGMAKHLTDIVFAVFVLLLFTVLAAAVRQDQRVVARLAEPTAVTVIDGHFVFCIAKVAIGTSPCEKSKQLFGLLSCS